MHKFILVLTLVALLTTQSESSTSQLVIGGITQSGIPLWSTWKQTFLEKLLNPLRYSIGLFTLQQNDFKLQSNLITFTPIQDIGNASAFDLITIEDVQYIVLAHGRYLYLLKAKNNHIQKVHQYLISPISQSYSDVKVIHLFEESYVFVLNTTSSQLNVFTLRGETLEPEPLSPYDLHEQGINQLQALRDDNTIYLFVTNYLRNTIRIYTFKNGRLQEQRDSPVNTTQDGLNALLPIHQNNKIYICTANYISHTIGIYSFSNGAITEKESSPLFTQGTFPTSLLTITRHNAIYLVVSNSGTKTISVFTFDNGILTYSNSVPVNFQSQVPTLNIHMSLIEHNNNLYVATYNTRGSNGTELFLFDFISGKLTPVSTIDDVPMNVTNMQSVKPYDQFTIIQTLQKMVPQLPTDLARLIAQYTTIEKNSFNLHKQHLIDTFVKERSFNVGQVLDLITTMSISTKQSNNFKILFNDFILPYYIRFYDMTPVEEWLNIIQQPSVDKQTLINHALAELNQHIQHTSFFFSPWLLIKLHLLHTKLNNALIH